MSSKEEKNKALVLEAFDTLFNKRDYTAAERFWSPNYIQHSAHIEPGRDGLFSLIKSIPPTLRYEPGVIVAEGDFVIIQGRFSGFGLPVNWIAADIIRMKDGILIEHWDGIQDEATKEQSKSGNPMFGDSFPPRARIGANRISTKAQTFIEESSVMKAVQIKSYGDPLEVLEVVDVSEPGAPGTNEALLGIEIATLNKHDLLFIGNALGRDLLKEAERRLEGQHFTAFTLWVLEKNVQGRQFYQAKGFRLDANRREETIGGSVLTEVRYEKRLASLIRTH